MSVVDLSMSKKEEEEIKLETITDTIREEILQFAKNFKTSWIGLGRHLYAVWQDKMYKGWGYEKFEDYTKEELGMKKSLCMKLLKTYLFIEQEEPVYLNKKFLQNRAPINVPGYDEVDVLRLAKKKKELTVSDYTKLRREIFDKGLNATDARKELTAIIKERKQIDPEEERQQRNEAAIKKMINAIESFKKDMEALKLIPYELIEQIGELKEKLAQQI